MASTEFDSWLHTPDEWRKMAERAIYESCLQSPEHKSHRESYRDLLFVFRNENQFLGKHPIWRKTKDLDYAIIFLSKDYGGQMYYWQFGYMNGSLIFTEEYFYSPYLLQRKMPPLKSLGCVGYIINTPYQELEDFEMTYKGKTLKEWFEDDSALQFSGNSVALCHGEIAVSFDMEIIDDYLESTNTLYIDYQLSGVIINPFNWEFE